LALNLDGTPIGANTAASILTSTKPIRARTTRKAAPTKGLKEELTSSEEDDEDDTPKPKKKKIGHIFPNLAKKKGKEKTASPEDTLIAEDDADGDVINKEAASEIPNLAQTKVKAKAANRQDTLIAGDVAEGAIVKKELESDDTAAVNDAEDTEGPGV
jgi:hypothetical protein